MAPSSNENDSNLAFGSRKKKNGDIYIYTYIYLPPNLSHFVGLHHIEKCCANINRHGIIELGRIGPAMWGEGRGTMVALGIWVEEPFGAPL